MPNFRHDWSIPQTFSGWRGAYLLHTEKSFIIYTEKSFVMRFFRLESSILQWALSALDLAKAAHSILDLTERGNNMWFPYIF